MSVSSNPSHPAENRIDQNGGALGSWRKQLTSLIRTAIQQGEDLMASNHGGVYIGPGKVEVQSIDYPELKTPLGKKVGPRRHHQADHDQHLRPVTSTWSAGAPPRRPDWFWSMRLPAKSSNAAAASNSSAMATWFRCHSTSPADDAATARSAVPTSAST
jgi:hypothetical protein